MRFPVEATAQEASASLERSQDRSNGDVRYFGAPRDGGTRLHAGVDLGAPDGSWSWANRKVYAVTDGTVAWVADSGAGGYMVTVHPHGDLPWAKDKISQVRYVHLNAESIPVRMGQEIKAGDYLGTLYGPKGYWPHLHIQFGPGVPGRDLSACIDPYPILKANAIPKPPTQLPEQEEDDIKVLTAVRDARENFQILGAEVGQREGKTAVTFINARAPEMVTLGVTVYAWPEKGTTIKKKLGTFELRDGRYKSFPITAAKLGVSGAFGVQLIPSDKALEMWAGGVVERK